MAVVVICDMDLIGGRRCPAEADVKIAVRKHPRCRDANGSELALCEACWTRASRRMNTEGIARCGCVVLEVIDLTKADPGPGYADMLRSL